MKRIDEYYKDWCGESHTFNQGVPTHDSVEVCNFAEFYFHYQNQNLNAALKSTIDKELRQRETIIKTLSERNNFAKLVSWVIKNKFSILLEADIHIEDKEQILRSLNHSTHMLHQ